MESYRIVIKKSAAKEIEKIEKKKATVNYGNFTTKVDLSKLELAK